MQEVVRGATVALDAVYRDASDNLVDPVTPLVDILDPANIVIVAGVVPVRSSLGLYDYPDPGYLVPDDADYGVWTARWTGTVDGDVLEALDEFEVVVALTPSSATALATVADLATYMQRDFSAPDTATASLLLDIASAAIRNYTGQTISAVTDDEITLDPPYGRRLFLPELPVTAVSSITVGGTLWTEGTDYYWYGDTGMVRLVNRWWGTTPSSVDVVYSHGYTTDPDEVRGVCLSIAARMLENPLGLTQQDIGPHGQAVDTEGNAELVYRSPLATGTTLPPPEITDEERRILDHYRPLVVA